MEQWRKDRTRTAWSFAWLFALALHQLLIPFLQGQDYDPTSFVITTVYFGVITFLFTWGFFLIPAWMMAIILFFFGAVVEVLIFNVIIDPIMAGLFYIAMFFIPRWISRRMFAEQMQASQEKEKD